MAVTANETKLGPARGRLLAQRVRTIRQTLHEVVVGQDEVIDQLLVCALTGSHALLVGVPGLAKTLMVKALAAAFRWKYARIQFTPDLMPADVTGYELLGRSGNGEGPSMVFRRGRSSPTWCWPTRSTGRRQNAVGPVGGDGRAARHRGRQDLPAGRAVPGGRHAEPDRAGGDLSAA